MNATDTWIEPTSAAFFGAVLGALLGLGLLGYGAISFAQSPPSPIPLSAALVISGGLNLLLCVLSLRRVRVAWSFAISLNGTAFVIFFFGVTKIRDGLGVHWMVAVALAMVFLVTTILLSISGHEYEAAD